MAPEVKSFNAPGLAQRVLAPFTGPPWFAKTPPTIGVATLAPPSTNQPLLFSLSGL